MSEAQMRHWLLFTIPVMLAYNHFVLGVGIESSLLVILTWGYNDLGGGDDNWILRNFIISCAFGLYNFGSFKVVKVASSHFLPSSAAIQTEFTASSSALLWAVMVSAVISTTMHVQDLKDIAGDRVRGRKSIAIVYGRTAAGWSVDIPVMFWSVVCVGYNSLSLFVAWIPIAVGVLIAWRCVSLDQRSADRKTWQLWCLWTAIFYLIPALAF